MLSVFCWPKKSGLRVLLVVLASVFANTSLADLTPRQAQLLANNCLQCHAVANVGAPLIGDAQAWATAAAKGEETLLRNVVEGIRSMPPMGYCASCEEGDFRALIRFMTQMTPSNAAASAEAGEAP